MHKNFSFKGLVRSNDNILANEGECLELVNLRMVNGSLKPIPETKEKAVLSERYSKIYWHDKASCYLCVRSDAPGNLCFYDSDWNPLLDSRGNRLDFPQLEKVRFVEFLGYIVICITESGICYIVFGDGTYRWLGECPPIPDLNIKLTSKLFSNTTKTVYTTSHINTNISSLWAYNSRGYLDERISDANKAGYYIDRSLFRFALRLYDGSYIYCSQIIYASDENNINGVARDSENLVSYPTNENETETTFQMSVLAFKPVFEFLNLDLSNWEGIVVGIDIFTTGSIMGKKIGTARASLYNTETSQNVTEKYEVYKDKELDELWNDINNASMFYKIAEYDIEGNLLSFVDDVSQANIVLQDSLSSYEHKSSLATIVPDCCYMFNNRLHVASLREYFFNGYDKRSFLPVGGETAVIDHMAVLTKIKTQNGVSQVVKHFNNIEVGYKYDKFQFPPLLMYPDSRAFEMSLFVVSGTETYMKTFALTPHRFLNQSQYLHKWYIGFDITVESVFASGNNAASVSNEDVLEIFNEEIGVHEVIYSAAMGCWTYKGVAFPPEEYSSLRIFKIPRDVTDGDKIIFTIKTGTSDTQFRDINNIPLDDTWQKIETMDECHELSVFENRDNVVKVSMVDNPFIFPAKCTSSLSQGKIIAISTNRTTMSEGQFGQHPLYVFSQYGIQVMAVDASATVAYSSIYPVSHEVCINPDSICGTDSGVVFLGTQGVMIIGGSRCLRLSEAMDDDSKELETIGHSEIIHRIASLHGLDGVADTAHFVDFMRTAKVARFSEKDELIFCNENYKYSFCYSMSGNVWSKIGESFTGFVKQCSEFFLFRHKGGNTVIHIPDNSFSGKNNVLLVTRPHLFGTKLPKRIMQLMLHAYLSKPADGDVTASFISCYLLCSNDGVHFKIVSGCERNKETQDIVFPYFPTSSYRYYMFALSGELNSCSMITGLEIDVNPSWNNRLR